MTTVEEIALQMVTLRAEFEASLQQLKQQHQEQLTQQVNRTVAVEQDMQRLQAKLGEKKENHGKGRDLFISKKGFSDLPQFDGKAEK